MEGDTLTIYPQGDLDLVTAKQVRKSVDAMIYSRCNVKSLAINLDKVGFIDSSGLGMLIGCYKMMKQRQGKIILCDADPNVYRLLELSGMRKLMPILQKK